MRLRGLLTFVFGDMGYVIILIVYPNKWHGQLYVTKHYISTRLGLNEFFKKLLVELHRDSGLFLQSFGYF